ncbi:Pycsar system effector family protein [Oleiharenicola lentus]|uniref:Pycsar system effector family protein n=1 Tax=Oleiharenicola lentus TaxID=2508720 RepID=UPI003F681BE7
MSLKVPATTHADTLVRETRAHHLQLSAMADVKANMLITMSCIITTLCIPRISPDRLLSPLTILVGFCLLTIGLATYAVMPKKSYHRKNAKRGATFNVLFFGDFTSLSFEQFKDEMQTLMQDHNLVYEAQLRETYQIGLFLADTKYQFLRFAYFSFGTGIVSSVGSLLVYGP